MQQLSGISTKVDKALSGANRLLDAGDGNPAKGIIEVLKEDLESINDEENESEDMNNKN